MSRIHSPSASLPSPHHCRRHHGAASPLSALGKTSTYPPLTHSSVLFTTHLSASPPLLTLPSFLLPLSSPLLSSSLSLSPSLPLPYFQAIPSMTVLADLSRLNELAKRQAQQTTAKHASTPSDPSQSFSRTAKSSIGPTLPTLHRGLAQIETLSQRLATKALLEQDGTSNNTYA